MSLLPKGDAAGDQVPAAAAEAEGRQSTLIMPIAQITITPQAAVVAEYGPNPKDNRLGNRLSNPQDIRAAAAATDPNLFHDHDGVQHHDDQTA
jgi:hypothetical protein